MTLWVERLGGASCRSSHVLPEKGGLAASWVSLIKTRLVPHAAEILIQTPLARR